MALKRDIKKIVRDEIITAVGTAVPSERILYASQETRDVDYPRIIYTLFDVPTDKYGTAPAPYKHITDSNGNKETAVYASFYTAFVDISIEGTTIDTDSLYEDVRSQWDQYELFTDVSTLHQHITEVTMDDAEDDNNREREPTVFDTIVSLEIEYSRDVTRDGTPIEEVHQNYDVDADSDDTVGDGTTDVSYTTS